MKTRQSSHLKNSAGSKNGFIVFFVVLGIFLFIGIFCYTHLEIVPNTRWEDPSRKVRANPYFALEKWLGESACPVRTLSMGNLNAVLDAPEKTIFIEISRLNWTGNLELLIPWLQEGGRLIISLDAYVNNNLTEFIKSLGVMASSFDGYENYKDYENDELDENNTAEETDEIPAENPPFFDWQMSFRIAEQKPPVDRILVMNSHGETKLVKLETGKGWIVFTGKTNFLHNYSLRREENVNLAGELFFTDGIADERGVLFIRTLSEDRYFLGNLADRGNPAALAVSLVLLIIVGFWMVIPPFGRYGHEPEKPGKPLRERFLAEGHFLKKHHALGRYIEIYKRELEQRSRSKELRAAPQSMSAASPVSAKPAAPVMEITFKQFVKEQKRLTEQLDQLNN